MPAAFFPELLPVEPLLFELLLAGINEGGSGLPPAVTTKPAVTAAAKSSSMPRREKSMSRRVAPMPIAGG